MRHGEWSWLIQRARGLERLAAAGDGEGCRAQLLSLSYEFERLYDEQALAFLRALDTPAATQADEGAMRRAQRALCRAVRTVLDLPAGAAARQVLSPAVVALAQSWRPPGEKAAALEEKEQRLLALGGRGGWGFRPADRPARAAGRRAGVSEPARLGRPGDLRPGPGG